MAVTASLVRELRERTSAPMMDCKKALDSTNGDIEAAIEAMRKSGQAKAVKKAGRVTAEGTIVVKSNDKDMVVIVEVNCETDFVARDENFTAFADSAAQIALDNSTADLATIAEGVEETRQTLVAKLGENIQVRRSGLIQSTGTIGSYLHGSKIGVIVDLEGGDAELARDIAMHVAASKPEVVNPEDVSEERVAGEKRLFVEQARESGKPDEIIEKMITGRMRKFVGEISLVGQAFVKDPSMSVGDLLKQKSAKVISFIRYEVGEGVEKQEVDFRDEVMAQVKGS